jgi:hypothetical protein
MAQGEEHMKPVLWIHKASGRIRFDGENLPPSWIPLFAKEDLELTPTTAHAPMELPDKTRRIWDYIKDRKTPFQARNIAEHFAISTSTAAKHLSTLHTAGALRRTRKAKTILWEVMYKEPKEPKERPRPKQETDKADKPTPLPPPAPHRPRPTATSYPHARGYDD